MGEKVLNEGCVFQCNGNFSIAIRAVEEGNRAVRDRGRRILTDRARCQLKGPPMPCSFLTTAAGGSPVPCQMVSTSWTGTAKTMSCGGHPVLTMKSKMVCGACPGGVIRPVFSNCITGVGGIPITGGMGGGSEASPPPRQIRDPQEPDEGSGQELSREAKEREELDGQKGAGQEQETYASYAMCDYENCGERQDCPYFKSPVFLDNDSAKLRQNFERERKDQWEAYEARHKKRISESLEGGWRKAAHHLIPGNDVLMLKEEKQLVFGHLVKLANYFGYDVNNGNNCILLPTNEKGYGEKEEVGKMAGAYDAMWMMGRQWHSGPHDYPLSGDEMKKVLENYGQQHPEQYQNPGGGVPCANYVSVLREEMDRIGERYKRPRCWKKSYERRKKAFFQDMDNLSKKVERYLLDFEKDPKASFPFYVSNRALEYAFHLPAAVKIIVLYKDGGKTKAKRVRMERYKKDDLQIIPNEKETMEIGDSTDRRKWAVFCENARHFFADERVDTAEWYCFQSLQNPRGRPGIKTIRLEDGSGKNLSVMEYLRKHGSEIMAFVQQKEMSYEPAARMVSIRLGG